NLENAARKYYTLFSKALPKPQLPAASGATGPVMTAISKEESIRSQMRAAADRVIQAAREFENTESSDAWRKYLEAAEAFQNLQPSEAPEHAGSHEHSPHGGRSRRAPHEPEVMAEAWYMELRRINETMPGWLGGGPGQSKPRGDRRNLPPLR